MEEKQLTAELRKEFKKGAARRLRRDGRIPGIVYGHDEPIPISISGREFRKEFHTISESTLIRLAVDGKERQVLVKEYQEDIIKGDLLHIDFYEVEMGKALHTNVPIVLDGSPVGVREGGVLEHGIYELEISCVPKDLPAEIHIDISELQIGDSIHVADVTAPEGVTILNNGDQTIAVCASPRAMEAEIEAEEAEAAEEAGELEGEEGAEEEGVEESEEE
ncbi:MAG: 50S ribosomal protein L25/general stress protein Ctc [Spirochaetaceae bacterium]